MKLEGTVVTLHQIRWVYLPGDEKRKRGEKRGREGRGGRERKERGSRVAEGEKGGRNEGEEKDTQKKEI